jgi:hypothetical protein
MTKLHCNSLASHVRRDPNTVIVENPSTWLNIPHGARSEGTIVRKYVEFRFEVMCYYLDLAARGPLARWVS